MLMSKTFVGVCFKVTNGDSTLVNTEHLISGTCMHLLFWGICDKTNENEKTVLRHGSCFVHGGSCNIAAHAAMVHLAGSSCTAWSPAGLTDGATAMTHAYFLAWVARRRLIQEPIVVHECTDGFPRDLFDLLLPMYNWSSARIDPISYGAPVRRVRQWTVYLVQ